jgi:hypothetical protein
MSGSGHRNTTSRDIDDVEASWPGGSKRVGIIPPGIDKAQAGVVDPIPESVTVTWKEADGAERKQVVAIPRPLPELKKGQYVFRFFIREAGVVLEVGQY